jgi:hypothetical protein
MLPCAIHSAKYLEPKLELSADPTKGDQCCGQDTLWFTDGAAFRVSLTETSDGAPIRVSMAKHSTGYKLTYADLDVWLRPTIKANSFEHNPATRTV